MDNRITVYLVTPHRDVESRFETRCSLVFRVLPAKRCSFSHALFFSLSFSFSRRKLSRDRWRKRRFLLARLSCFDTYGRVVPRIKRLENRRDFHRSQKFAVHADFHLAEISPGRHVCSFAGCGAVSRYTGDFARVSTTSFSRWPA